MNTILSTWGKNCISVKNVISHFATGRISRVMQKVMWKSSIQPSLLPTDARFAHHPQFHE